MLSPAASIAAAPLWRRRLIALLAGAVGALAMAPFGLMPALAIAMTGAVWLIDAAVSRPDAKPTAEPRGAARVWRKIPAAARRAFAAGWWWGFGYFLASLWWLGAAFLVEADQFVWAMPLGVIGLPAAMAFYPALGFFLASLLWTQGPARILTFAAALTLAEWLRGHLFTGFPWNAFGMALGGNLLTAQAASLTGLYGLTLLAIALFSAPATLAARPLTLRSLAPTGGALLALAALFGFGAWRLAASPAPAPQVPGVAIKIIQPNLAQDDKYRPEYKREIVERYLQLSALSPEAKSNDLTLLVWPESAFPFILSRDPEAMAQIGEALPPGVILATGAARAEEDPSYRGDGFEPASGRLEHPVFFNAIQLIASGGLLIGAYDKSHLVPFGEYLPFEAAFARLGLRQFVSIPGGFEAGPGRRTLNVPGLPPVAPLICYEAIFPGEALPQEPGAPRPGLMLNVTDDGWFGHTAGPYQHFAQARLRTIEEGLPMLRAANTGISAIIDPYGRITESLPLGVEGLVTGALPQAIDPPLYARHGLFLPLALWLICTTAGIMAFLRRTHLTRVQQLSSNYIRLLS
ncbi:apolipoprotein N-acyltransferase [Methylocella silvestris BL2]|uniref:Apolipoprotein N-acyltransferase n=1 Tax=Methylocella silvestris (strain DSM 15510 / CIP 108128 / LMG 27833 / NCIMB 13906 / BL2) TaxID=395965 RepID=B8ETG7_METSB|nr:apolipoprotein N-acyltransferase [Methylocella silvestris]ACK51809.1 apolipoprotein N-acyltransferase [Methylocella silvestris BL2]